MRKYKKGRKEKIIKIVQQDDHLILPYSTLKRFMNEKNEISVLDLNDFDNVQVIKKRPKTYHTETNYFIPEYDEEVKKSETLIGSLNAKIKKIIEEIENDSEPSVQIDRKVLKKQIIAIVTVEFHRLVIVDDEKLKQYCEQQQQRNDDVDKKLLIEGTLTKERAEYSANFRKKAASLKSFRPYAQNLLGSKNDNIDSMYKGFEAYILYIPNSYDYSFWLPPFHFIGNEMFLYLVISPKIALAMYPPQMSTKALNGLKINRDFFVEADKKKVDWINSRTLECIGVMPVGFKEIIGGRTDMDDLCKLFKQLNEHIVTEKKSVVVSEIKGLLKDELSVFRSIIALHLMCGNKGADTDLVIESEVFDKEHIKLDMYEEIGKEFKKYGFNLRIESVV